MLFNSLGYLFFFLPLTLGSFIAIGKIGSQRSQLILLLVASLVFYMWWNPIYLLLLLFSIGFNFYASHLLQKKIHTLGTVVTAICINLGLLAYFKYANFFVGTINHALDVSFTLEKIILPLAISFFTFQQISYLVDVYKGKIQKTHFIEYCLFVSFFPQLIAGPIVRFEEVITQFRSTLFGTITKQHLRIGLSMLVIGLFKKSVMADEMGVIVDPIYSAALAGEVLSFSVSWIAAIGYGLQLYFDFSGYSDMAIGSAYLFGIRLPDNFLSPYKSLNIQEFWKRWHISLSRFLLDYLYIPLGGSRKGYVRTLLNLMITMLLGGLWHGAGWGFILWGGIHGIFLVVFYIWKQYTIRRSFRLPIILAWLCTYTVVTIAWLLFRAESLGAAILLLKGVFGLSGMEFVMENSKAAWIVFGLLFVWVLPNTQQLMVLHPFDSSEIDTKKVLPIHWQSKYLWSFVLTSAAILGLLHLGKPAEFIYFQF